MLFIIYKGTSCNYVGRLNLIFEIIIIFTACNSKEIVNIQPLFTELYLSEMVDNTHTKHSKKMDFRNTERLINETVQISDQSEKKCDFY